MTKRTNVWDFLRLRRRLSMQESNIDSNVSFVKTTSLASAAEMAAADMAADMAVGGAAGGAATGAATGVVAGGFLAGRSTPLSFAAKSGLTFSLPGAFGRSAGRFAGRSAGGRSTRLSWAANAGSMLNLPGIKTAQKYNVQRVRAFSENARMRARIFKIALDDRDDCARHLFNSGTRPCRCA